MFIVKSTLSNGLSITVTLVKEWTSFSDNKLLSNKPYTAPNFEHTAFKHNLEMWWVIAIYITIKKIDTRSSDGTASFLIVHKLDT